MDNIAGLIAQQERQISDFSFISLFIYKRHLADTMINYYRHNYFLLYIVQDRESAIYKPITADPMIIENK